VTLLPQIVEEAAYFWSDPVLQKDSLLSTVENPGRWVYSYCIYFL